MGIGSAVSRIRSCIVTAKDAKVIEEFYAIFAAFAVNSSWQDQFKDR